MTLLRTIQDTALDTCFAGPSGILQPALRPILFLQFCLEAYLVNPDPSQVPSFFERYNAALPTVKDLHQRLLATWSAEAPGSA